MTPHLQTPARRFCATIYKQGPNSYIDVPPSVGRAFAEYAPAGRISVVGTLNKAPIRGTLIPAGRGRHRLYVNGGMRSAAGAGTMGPAGGGRMASHRFTAAL